MAQDNKFPTGLQFGVGASATSGLNGFVGYANKNFDNFWAKRFGVRFDFASTSPIKSAVNSAVSDITGDGIDIGDNISVKNGALSARHFGALVDFYPFGNTWFAGGWRLSTGYMTGKTNLTADITGNAQGLPDAAFEFDLDGISYRYNGNEVTGHANINWKYSGPYLGTGFDLGLFWGIKIYMDAGVVFTSKTAAAGLDVPLNDQLEYWNGTTWQNVEASGKIAEFENAKAAALSEAQDELDKIKYYPIVKLGFMYRF